MADLLKTLPGLLVEEQGGPGGLTAVSVRGGEANVILTAESGGQRYTCRTEGGECDIEGVATGRYVATAEPIGEGRAPVPRPVMVAGSGSTVTVHLRLR